MDTQSLSTVWAIMQFVSCVVIAYMLLMRKRNETERCVASAWLTWIWVVIALAVIAKLLSKTPPPVGPFEALLSFALAALILWYGGNMATLHRDVAKAAKHAYRRIVH